MKLFKWPLLATFMFIGCGQAQAVDLLDYIPDSEELLLATTGVQADQYLADAIAAGDGRVVLPRGRLNFADTIHLKRSVHLLGEGGKASITRMVFAANKNGIVIHRCDTDFQNGNFVVVRCDMNMRGDNSIIEGVEVIGSGTVGHGIWMKARATLQDVSVAGFGGNCVHINASSGTSSPLDKGNANNWRVDAVRLAHCKNGLSIGGTDVNAGLSIGVDASFNDEYGIYDRSFLGNTHIAPHAAANGRGPYKTTNQNAHNVFIGAYSEGDQPASDFVKPTLVLGGLHGAGITGSAQVIGNVQ
jgi:hypothetical protein